MRAKLLSLLSSLIEFDSSAGREAEICGFMRSRLQQHFKHLIEIPVSAGRFNLLAYDQNPRIVFSTHLDVVTADRRLFVPRCDDERIYGRGACDAKSMVVCMLEACQQLQVERQTDFAVLLVVGEESSGDGALAARPVLSQLATRFVVNGEPTDLKTISSQLGAIDFRLSIKGRACHSGYPERGSDANLNLLEAISRIRNCLIAADPNALINFGKFAGGSAANVISAEAMTEFCIRSELPSLAIASLVKQSIRSEFELETLFQSEAVKPLVVPGFESGIAKFASDLPTLLSNGMKGVLYGPGDIHLAHCDDESIVIDDMITAVSGYKQIFYYLKGQNA